LQLPLSGLQVAPSHVPLQHSASLAQASLSAAHCELEHLPPTHEKVQQSLPL
jgi:hypothetical protein